MNATARLIQTDKRLCLNNVTCTSLIFSIVVIYTGIFYFNKQYMSPLFYYYIITVFKKWNKICIYNIIRYSIKKTISQDVFKNVQSIYNIHCTKQLLCI